MTQNEMKQAAALEAVKYVKENAVLGVGTGSTVNFFIDALEPVKHQIKGAVSSSKASTARLEAMGIPVLDLNNIQEFDIYVDGADEINETLDMIKGGGAALTREKIVSAVAKQFICIVDETKLVKTLGKFPLPVEVIPMARAYVARELGKLGGEVVYREGVVTDNGNDILDVHGLSITNPQALEEKINNIVGVVTCGIFSRRGADVVLAGTAQGVKTISRS